MTLQITVITDLNRAKPFYGESLGCPIEQEYRGLCVHQSRPRLVHVDSVT